LATSGKVGLISLEKNNYNNLYNYSEKYLESHSIIAGFGICE